MEKTLHNHNFEIVSSVYKSCYSDLLHYLTSYTHDVMSAEDMLQDIFIKMMSLDVITAVTAVNLAFVMAKRMIIDDARHKAFVRQQEKKLRETQPLYDSYSVAHKIEHDEVAAMESRFLKKMAPKRAEVYRLYRHDELSSQEIADRLNLSRRTVETHIYLSTKQMRQQMRAAL